MALVIEDGSGVLGANSYVTVDEVKAYAEARGLDLPDTDAGVEAMAVQAFDYLESLGSKYKGRRVFSRTQWPRAGVVIDCQTLDSSEIPWQLKEAQCQATVEATTSDLMPNPEAAVKREKVDVLETEYQDSAPSVGGAAYLPKVDAKLADLMSNTSKRIRVFRA